VACVVALLSVGLGLLGTPLALDISSLAHVFIGLDPEGRHWQFGPYFCVMHTTFIPLIVYLALLWVCWTAKVALLVGRLFVGRAMHQDINGLRMTSGLFAVFAAVLGAATYFTFVAEQLLNAR